MSDGDVVKQLVEEDPHYLGHRERLRDRFIKGGAEALSDYELLELLLFIAIPRRDVKPLAKSLFANVITAEPDLLTEFKFIGDNAVAAIKMVQAAALALMRENIMAKPVIGSWQAVLDYCRASMAYNQTEQFRILFLDRKNVLIADEIQQKGTIDHTPVYPREVIKRALALQASAIILCHNHPSGDPAPSRDDNTMTRNNVDAAKKLGIAVHDHIVVGKKGIASFKTLGLL
jgi:DNA repair protein RadC